MNNFRNTVAVLALLCASGMAYAQEAAPAAPAPEVQNKVDCPAAGTVPEADLSAECKAAGSASNAQPTDPAVTIGTTEVPKQDNTAATPAAPAPESTAAAPATPAPDSATTTVGNTEVPSNAVLAS